MVVSVVPPNPIIIIILSPSREVRRERRAPIIKSTIHKFLSALSSPHGSRRLLPSSAASVVSRGPCLCRALSFTVARETETRAPPLVHEERNVIPFPPGSSIVSRSMASASSEGFARFMMGRARESNMRPRDPSVGSPHLIPYGPSGEPSSLHSFLATLTFFSGYIKGFLSHLLGDSG